MAYDWNKGAAYLSDILMGMGSGMLQRPQGGPPLAGFGMGLQNANQMLAQRRQMEQEKLREEMMRATFQQQQEALAEQKRVKDAQRNAFNSFLPPVADPNSPRPPVASTQANPMLTGMSPEQVAFLRAYGSADPGGALGMIGEQAFAKPNLGPAGVQEYEYAKSQGFTGSFLDFEKQKAEAGRAPIQPPQLPADVQEYLFAKRQDPNIGTYAEWKKSQTGGDLRYGLSPVYGTDENGNTVLLLPNTQGGITKVQTPEGVTISPQAQFLNTGTAQVPVDKRTGQPIPNAAPIPIDVSGEKSQTTQGEAQGKVAAALPDTIAAADLALKTIDDLKNDPARELATGMSALVTNKVPGTPAYDYVQKVEQAKGQVFRQVYETLRGGGAITEIESGKAQQALARLDTAQTEEGFLQALNELEGIIKSGAERAKQKAAAGPQLNPQPAAPAVPPPPPGFEVVQ